MFKTKKSKIILTLVLLSYFITILDNSIVFTATTKLAADLQLTPASLAWVQTAYAIVYGSLLLLGGRLGDLFGRKKVFLIAIFLFGSGSLAVGLSGTSIIIVSSRAFQGIGAAILAPTTLAVLMDSFHGEERTAAVSGYGSVAGLGSAVGLILGGLLATFVSWRAGFLINVPLALLVLGLGWYAIPVDSSHKHQDKNLDLSGTFFSVVSIFSLIYAVNGSKTPVAMIVLAILTLFAFIYTEKNTSNPLLPLTLFANRERVAGYLIRFLYLGGMMGFWFTTPQMLQSVFGWTPVMAALGFLPLSIINFMVALQVTRLIKKFSNTLLLVLGIGVTSLGFVWLLFFTKGIGYWWGIGLPMAILGLGQGLSFSPMTNAGIAQTTASENGAASGLLNTVHQVGGSFGLSMMVILGQHQGNAIGQYQIGIVVSVIFLLLALIVSMILLVQKSNK